MTNRIIGLERRIFDYIEKTYETKFLGEVHVHISPNCVYTMCLVFNNIFNPIVMDFECCSDEEFYKKATKQLS
jgi:hypothetical protein